MTKAQPIFQPLSMVSTILELTRSTLEASKEQLIFMRKVRQDPHVLDNDTINRSLKLYTKQNEDSTIFIQQCTMWRKEQLTQEQLKQIQEIENNTYLLKSTNNQILVILNYCKNFTIDKILAKDDLELVLDALTGEIPFPKNKL